MDPDEVYKNKIGERITRTLADALSGNVISEDDARTIADYVLKNMDGAKTSGEILDFLTELTNKYSIFSSLLTIELGQTLEQKEDIAVEKTEDLLKENKIDEALAVVGKASDRNVKGGQNA